MLIIIRYVGFEFYVLFTRSKVYYVKFFDKHVKSTGYIIINSCSFSVQRISYIISTVAYPTTTECNNYSMILILYIIINYNKQTVVLYNITLLLHEVYMCVYKLPVKLLNVYLYVLIILRRYIYDKIILKLLFNRLLLLQL